MAMDEIYIYCNDVGFKKYISFSDHHHPIFTKTASAKSQAKICLYMYVLKIFKVSSTMH